MINIKFIYDKKVSFRTKIKKMVIYEKTIKLNYLCFTLINKLYNIIITVKQINKNKYEIKQNKCFYGQ